jgi:hypothetical protein
MGPGRNKLYSRIPYNVLMNTATAPTHSPLEGFVRDYADVTGGVWDEIEPQVYDLLSASRKCAWPNCDRKAPCACRSAS